MTPQLQQVYQDLNHLSPIERWQILEHLIGQFRSTIGINDTLPYTPKPSAQEILATTQGSWGNHSLDEIDAQLAHQRQLDWGE
jgi:hypothetical protein